MSIFRSPNNIRIALTGGGTGGHIFPLIAILRELRNLAQKNQINLDIRYIGPNDFAANYMAKEGLITKNIFSGKFRRSFNPKDLFNDFIDIFKIIAGFFQSLWQMLVYMPDLIISKGGYGSVPVMMAGTFYAIPKAIHESDSIPGLANTVFAKFARRIFVAFEKSKDYFPKNRTVVVGNPIRPELLKGDKLKSRQYLQLNSDRPIVLVLGGSQGAKSINDILLDILPDLVERTEVIHQTGIYNFSEVEGEVKVIFQEIIKNDEFKKYYHPVAFLEEKTNEPLKSLKDVMWAADLIVSRAGSGAIFEIAALGKPSILIPLPWASRDHQTQNAYEYAENGSAEVIESSNLTPNVFSDLIIRLAMNKDKLNEMSQKALAFSKPQAALHIAQQVLEIILLRRHLKISL